MVTATVVRKKESKKVYVSKSKMFKTPGVYIPKPQNSEVDSTALMLVVRSPTKTNPPTVLFISGNTKDVEAMQQDDWNYYEFRKINATVELKITEHE